MALHLSPEVRWLSVDDGIVIFIPHSSGFVDLNASAAELWNLMIHSAWDVGAAVVYLTSVYSTAAGEAEQIVNSFLEDLKKNTVLVGDA